MEKKKASAALEKLKHERSATLLRSQQAETKANAAEAKKEALRMATSRGANCSHEILASSGSNRPNEPSKEAPPCMYIDCLGLDDLTAS